MKIAIGTVQLGLLYGINNNIGIPSDNEVLKIFSLANKESIRYIDTSISYGNSELYFRPHPRWRRREQNDGTGRGIESRWNPSGSRFGA